MRKSKIIKWNGQEITCKELTVEEVRNLMDHPPETTVLDALFMDRIPVAAIQLSTGISTDELWEMTPSALVPLWDAVEELNPFFVHMLKKLAEQGRAVSGSL